MKVINFSFLTFSVNNVGKLTNVSYLLRFFFVFSLISYLTPFPDVFLIFIRERWAEYNRCQSLLSVDPGLHSDLHCSENVRKRSVQSKKTEDPRRNQTHQVSNAPVPEPMGVICAAVYLIVMFFFIPFPFFQWIGNEETFPYEKLLAILSGLISISTAILLGFADDMLDLRWRHKLLFPTLSSLPLLMVYYVSGLFARTIFPPSLLQFRQLDDCNGAVHRPSLAPAIRFSPSFNQHLLFLLHIHGNGHRVLYQCNQHSCRFYSFSFGFLISFSRCERSGKWSVSRNLCVCQFFQFLPGTLPMYSKTAAFSSSPELIQKTRLVCGTT